MSRDLTLDSTARHRRNRSGEGGPTTLVPGRETVGSTACQNPDRGGEGGLTASVADNLVHGFELRNRVQFSDASRLLLGNSQISNFKFQIPISIARSRSATALLMLVGLLGLLTACGKVGPPTPPRRIAERTSDLQGVQRGSSILLSWPGPPLNQNESSIKYVVRADVYRLEERRDQEPVLDREDYRNAAHPVGFLNRQDIETQLKRDGFLHYLDNLDLGTSTSVANLRLRYAVRYVNSRDQEAPFSNTVAIEPVTLVSLPPARLEVKDEAQDRVSLVWKPPAANINGSQPAGVVGYNVYRRRAKSDGQPELLNPEPLGDPSFTDTRFKYAVPYIYTVRALSQGSTGLIESADSNEVPFTPRDKFSPSAPDPVSIASANAVISLFWPTSPERDVVGYIVYRSESPDAKPQDWTRLTAEPISTVTFRDDHVRLGIRYYYRVTAIDGFKNESVSSTIVSEVANP